jgi:tungstate transport system substrate-binding protein
LVRCASAARAAVAAAILAAALFGIVVAADSGFAKQPFIVLASTTSTENSGLFAHILPRFEKQTGISVRVVAVGTGQAVRIAQRGDADVLLVHHRPSEERFVAEGFGTRRYDVMYNDFVIVGPKPAQSRGDNVVDALLRIAGDRRLFISRGDDSGTHKKEMALWAAAGFDPRIASGTWYRETGSGMGATLNVAAALGASTLSDRATWLSFANKRNLEIQVSGDPILHNQYGVIPVNPARHPHVREGLAGDFVGWLLSGAGQAAIASFRIHGQQAFFPNAGFAQ